MMLMRLLVRLYALPRLATVDGIAMGRCSPRRGAVAGCSFADLCMRIFLVPRLDEIVALRSVDVGNAVDDIQLSKVGPPRVVAANVSAAYKRMRGVLSADGLVVNDGKGVVLSNSSDCGRE
eukprot:1835584-Pyramimonas_sp.AAC.1